MKEHLINGKWTLEEFMFFKFVMLFFYFFVMNAVAVILSKLLYGHISWVRNYTVAEAFVNQILFCVLAGVGIFVLTHIMY